MASIQPLSAWSRAKGWLVGIGVAAFLSWLGWYGYDEQRATTRGLHVIGLLRDVQTCVGLSYEANQRQLTEGAEFRSLPRMKTTPYASSLIWDTVTLRATATFANTHRDYDGRVIWTSVSIDGKGELRWTCGSTVDGGARSYRNVAAFIARCDRPLAFDRGVADYCRSFVPLPQPR